MEEKFADDKKNEAAVQCNKQRGIKAGNNRFAYRKRDVRKAAWDVSPTKKKA